MICLVLDYYFVDKKIDIFYFWKLVFIYINFLRVFFLMDIKIFLIC